MECGSCRQANDADARYCTGCGAELVAGGAPAMDERRRSFRFAYVLIPALLAAAAIGYYKFFPAKGVAAVVNGETISLSEVDDIVRGIGRERGPSQAPPISNEDRVRLRHAVLSELIAERIAAQEAKRAGVELTAEELRAGTASLQHEAGEDAGTFARRMQSRYGSTAAFEQALARRLLVNKYLSQTIARGAAGPADYGARVERWFGEVRAKASVRIALAEQLPASGCGCCSGPNKAQGPAAGRQAAAAGSPAEEAVLRHWRERNNAEPAATKATDYGCHVQVDVVGQDGITKSYRYQNGVVAEL